MCYRKFSILKQFYRKMSMSCDRKLQRAEICDTTPGFIVSIFIIFTFCDKILENIASLIANLFLFGRDFNYFIAKV